MLRRFAAARRPAAALVLTSGLLSAWVSGCGFSADAAALIGFVPFTDRNDTGSGGGGGDGDGDGDPIFGGGGTGSTDPCDQTNNRKFVTLSLQNRSQDHIHYFLVLIANVDTEDRAGAVCADDVGLYTDFGYTLIPDGQLRAFGNYCIEGPALIYFHENGAFQGTGGLASGIAPAQGNNPSFDRFFSGAGARVPVPDVLLFHNPGTGEGAALQVAAIDPAPCSDGELIFAAGNCNLDAFYYVDESDLLAGSTSTGSGAGRRIPSEIQDTGCVSGFQLAGHQLAAANATASNASDFEFFRGGRIEYVFIREDNNPPIPQLLWRVTDGNGALVHDFDPRANIN